MTFPLSKNSAYIIAEAGVNHDGNTEQAKQLIDVAAKAKADAVKFQLFDPDEIVTEQAPLAQYQERSGKGSQKDMLRHLTLPRESYPHLKIYAEKKGLDFIVTPFDIASARFLAGLGVTVIKIPSGELTNLPFLTQVAALGIPTILSTGMSTIEEISEAILPFQNTKTLYALLHCVSAYPAPVDQINLRAMETMRTTFVVPIGYSDHTEGIGVAVTAAALGAEIIEKHFTISRSLEGPDHAASLEPDELTKMIRIIRDPAALKKFPTVTKALGSSEKSCQPCESNVRDVARRSVILLPGVPAGTLLTSGMLSVKRPGTGIAPRDLDTVPGKRTLKDLPAGTPLSWDVLE